VTTSTNKHSTLNLMWNSFGVESPGGGRGGRKALNWEVTGKFKLQRSHRPLRLTFLIEASCQGFLLLGYGQGVMSGFIGANNQFAQECHQPDAKLKAIITSIYDIGDEAGALLNFFFGEQLGRKNIIIAGGTNMIVGTVLLGSSTTLAQLLFGRIVTGIGNGFNSSTIPMYQYKMCKPSNRSVLFNMQGTVTIIGLCIAYWLDFGLSFAKGPIQGRLPISFQAFLSGQWRSSAAKHCSCLALWVCIFAFPWFRYY